MNQQERDELRAKHVACNCEYCEGGKREKPVCLGCADFCPCDVIRVLNAWKATL